MKKLSQQFLQLFTSDHFLFYLVSTAVGIRLFSRCGHNIFRLDVNNFTSFQLWEGFIVSASLYGALALTAYLFNKIYEKTSALAVFVILLLAGYLFALASVEMRIFSDVLSLRLGFLALVAMMLLLWIKVNKRTSKPRITAGVTFFLLVLWLVHAITNYLGFNFLLGRLPIADESTFWYKASVNIINVGFLSAHQIGYPGGDGHPLSIPFISALPAIIFQIPNARIPFLMPIVIIFGLLLFLNSLLRREWVFLYFLIALFSVFHGKGWLGELTYRLIGGEGFSMLLFLAVGYEVARCSAKEKIDSSEFYLVSFLAGLVALSKFPLVMMSIVYFLFFVCLTWRRSTANYFLGALLYLFPAVIWLSFRGLFDMPPGFSFPGIQELAGRILAPNIFALKEAWRSFCHDGENLLYFTLISTGMVIFSGKKDIIRHLIPFLIFLSMVGFHYAYIYNYGELQGDFGSSLRYVMPSGLIIFYLGALGFEEIFRKVSGAQVGPFFRMCTLLGILTLVLAKIF